MTLDELKKEIEEATENAIERANKYPEDEFAFGQAMGAHDALSWVRHKLEEVTE